MIKSKIICDRCGKACEYVRIHNYFMYRYRLKKPSGEDVDLCQKCLKELTKWMKGESE